VISKGFQYLLFITNYLKLTGVKQQSFPVVQEVQRRQLTLLFLLWEADTMCGTQLTSGWS
jgi:hypothetical protein